MTIGAFGELAYAELPAAYDNSVANPFRALLDNPDAQLVYLIEAYPYDAALEGTLSGIPTFGAGAFGEFDVTVSGGETMVYLSDKGFITEPGDDPADTYFQALVDNPLQLDVSIMSGDDFGGGSPSFGSIVIKNGGGDLDDLIDYHWSGRRLVVKAGGVDFTYDQFATVFNGLAHGIEADDENLIISIIDNRLKTERLIETDLYAGTGGLEGGDDLANTPKPLCYGRVWNLEPVLVDAANLIYQVHSGSVFAIDGVRDAGAELTSGGNVADIEAASVSAGQYKTQLTGGYIKLGSTPEGRITADVRGDDTGGYAETVGEIAQRIVKTKLGARSLATTEIDGGSFNRLDAELTGEAGVYITERVAAADILDFLINPCAAYWTFTRQGLLYAGFVESPDSADLEITEDDIEEDGVKIAETFPPAWRISVGYAPAGVVQKEDELVASTTDADRTFAGEAYRYVVAEDRSVRTLNAHAIERVFNTQIALKADAETLLTRLQAVFQTQRRVYRVALRRVLFRVYVGDFVRMTYDRHGLSNGKYLMVVGVGEDAESGTTTLELWG